MVLDKVAFRKDQSLIARMAYLDGSQCFFICDVISEMVPYCGKGRLPRSAIFTRIRKYFMVKTVQGAKKCLLYMRQISKALIRRRAICAATDHGLRYVSRRLCQIKRQSV